MLQQFFGKKKSKLPSKLFDNVMKREPNVAIKMIPQLMDILGSDNPKNSFFKRSSCHMFSQYLNGLQKDRIDQLKPIIPLITETFHKTFTLASSQQLSGQLIKDVVTLAKQFIQKLRLKLKLDEV